MLLRNKLLGSKWTVAEMGLLVLLKVRQILFLLSKTLDFTPTLRRWSSLASVFHSPVLCFAVFFYMKLFDSVFCFPLFQFGTELPIRKPESSVNWGRQVKAEKQRIHCGGGDFHHENGRIVVRPVDFSQSTWSSMQRNHQRNPSQSCAPAVPSTFHGGGSAPKKECAGTGVFLPRRYDNNPPQPRKRAGTFNNLQTWVPQIWTWILIFALCSFRLWLDCYVTKEKRTGHEPICSPNDVESPEPGWARWNDSPIWRSVKK